MRKFLPITFLTVLSFTLASCAEEKPVRVITESEFALVGDGGKGKRIFVHDLETGNTLPFEKFSESLPFLVIEVGEKSSYYFIMGQQYDTTTGYIDSVSVFFHDSTGTRNLLGAPKVSKIFANVTDETVLNLNFYDIDFERWVATRNTYSFDTTGSMIKRNKKAYNLVKKEVPEYPAVKISNLSPGGNFSVYLVKGYTAGVAKKTTGGKKSKSVKGKSKKTAKSSQPAKTQKGAKVYLSGANFKKDILITETELQIDRIYWGKKEEFVIIQFSDLQPEKTDETTNSLLLVYSLTELKETVRFAGKGYRNFTIKGNILIFDEFENDLRTVKIYDLAKKEAVRQIRMKNGCSIRFLPFYRNID
ncbi:MAG: hypothetical protein LC102_09940 [Ignavibacteriales bacterium]|nr:MAG: hypothetical protein F9K26_01565 [Ignavibacteriaceae bacterium]MBW7872100.1 hypothetical protein [Ignavibacteria bacterium]MCZ2143734.1 hypothetical protein [Ignavibacteriales bacterium]OQY69776.1 MAG: hypothetical protein B6D45_12280 [Ignavibacteriales bacterium UTCHB3]MBV6446004.1 hypothetical protein [Ignavibacteriaceae bacterium]